MHKGRTVRVLVLGDGEVGKTTFISTIVSEVSQSTQKILKPVILPPNMCQSSKEVYTELIDSHSSKTNLRESIPKIDIILLMYDISRPQTVDRILEYWLPVISGINNQVPIVVVGNKIDKYELGVKDLMDYKSIKEVLKPLLSKFKQVQMGLQCSAYYNRNVSKVLHCLQSAVLYPMGPIYSLSQRDITPAFRKILTRVFRIVDQDFDGFLSDEELTILQERVFETKLGVDHIKRVKQTIRVELEEYDLNEVPLKGWIALNKKLVELKNMQICWSVLHRFGYDSELKPKPIEQRLDFRPELGATIELKDKPRDFLIKLFQLFQQANPDNPRKLIAEIFQPVGIQPLPELLSCQDLDLQKFVVIWSYQSNRNYLPCYQKLLGIGYQGSLTDTFEVNYPKTSFADMEKLHQRSVLYVAMLDSGGEQREYFEHFFGKGVVIQNGIQRSYFMYSLEHGSKVVFVYRVTPDKIQQFFADKFYSKLIDIVVYAQSSFANQPQSRILKTIPKNTLKKGLSAQELNECKKFRSLSELDLSRFPVDFKKIDLNKLFAPIWAVIKKPQLGLPPETVAEMKKLNRREWSKLSGLFLIGTMVTGLIAYKLFSKR